MGPSKPRLVDLRGGRDVPPVRPSDMRSQQPRRSPLRQRRQRLRAVITAAVCVCTLLTAYALHAASYLERFTYQHVAVSGAESLSPSVVQKFVSDRLVESSQGFISGRNIFVFDYAPLERDIVQNFPRIKTAHVSRDTTLGNGLVVILEERAPFARWCPPIGQECFLMDDTGIVFASEVGIATSTLLTPYVFTGALSSTTLSVNAPLGETFAAGHFSGITLLLKMLGESGMRAEGARLVNETDFSVALAEGFFLKVSYGADPETLTKNLALILSADALKGKTQLLEYVDLRFGNRVYYKLKGQPASN